MNQEQVIELLLQSLEHERGGIKVYETALKCVQNDDLREEFEKYLEETRNHERILIGVCKAIELDPEAPTPGREIVRLLGGSLVEAMNKALKAGKPEAAQIVACECVVLAETKDHFDWELIGECAKALKGDEQAALMKAYEAVEDEEDEHLYHSMGWARELWLESLGLPAVLPPPEERKDVKTAAEAAQAKEQREGMSDR
jgi:rubrerythrin